MGGVGLHRILRDKGREKSGIFGVGVRWNAVLSYNLGLSSLFYLPQVGALMFPTLSFSSSGYVMVCLFFFFYFQSNGGFIDYLSISTSIERKDNYDCFIFRVPLFLRRIIS